MSTKIAVAKCNRLVFPGVKPRREPGSRQATSPGCERRWSRAPDRHHTVEAEERVAAGLDAYDPDEVPPATDTPPQPEDITLNEDWQEERAEFRRQEDKGELGPVDERHPFPPTRYE